MTKPSHPSWRRYLQFWGPNASVDVDDEIDFHFEMRVREYVARGMSPAAARQHARNRFGDVTRAREECVMIDEEFARHEGRVEQLAAIRQDVTFALRLLRRQRLPSIVATACLALGIGASTTMFSVGQTLLLRPLPFANADRVFSIYTQERTANHRLTVSSYPDFVDWRKRARSFVSMAALQNQSFTILLDTPLRAIGGDVSASAFPTLGVRAESGRLFQAEDERMGAPKVLVVSHSFAEMHLGGAATVVGKDFIVAGEKQTIIGVIPDRLRYPSSAQMWAPLRRESSTDRRGSRNLDVFGLIRPGVSREMAAQEMHDIADAMAKENPEKDSFVTAAIEPLRERYVGSARAQLFALSGGALLVLLVACANVAALQVARATARAREIAVRTALGAARTRIIRQLLTESVVLALCGGTLGIGVALVGVRYVARSIAANAPAWMSFGVDLRALGFTMIAATFVGVVFGMAPALRLAGIDANDVLRGGRGSVGLSRASLQRLFVSGEIALSVMLLIGALLAVESVIRLQQVPLGVDPGGVVTFRVALQGPRYDSEPARARIIADLERGVSQLPGVRAVGSTTYAPIAGCCSQFGTQIEGQPVDPAHTPMVTGNIVTPGFFRSVRIPVLAGREFSDADDAAAPKVAIINETFARQYWPRGDAIGHRIDTGNGMSTIVGIVGDIKQARIVDAAEPQFYRPHLQDPWSGMTFTVSVPDGDPLRIIPDVRRIMKQLDPTTPIYGAQTLSKVLSDVIASHRLFGALFAAFAVVAVALATAGVYATMSFFVTQRTRELGLRVALGAESSRVVSYVMRQGAQLALAGGLAGLAAGILAARYLAHTLYGVQANEPRLFAGATIVLLLAALLATYGPARRASSVDPMVALRAE
jgi:putative ABC transport system permease protein